MVCRIQESGAWAIDEFINNIESVKEFRLKAVVCPLLYGAGEIITEMSNIEFRGLFDILNYLSKEDIGTLAIFGPSFAGGYSPRPVEDFEESVSATASQLLKAGIDPLCSMAIGIAQHIGDRYSAKGDTLGRSTISAFFITHWLRNMKWAEVNVRFVAAVVYGHQWGPCVPGNVKKEIEALFAPYDRKNDLTREAIRAIRILG